MALDRGAIRDLILVSDDCAGGRKLQGRGALFGRFADRQSYGDVRVIDPLKSGKQRTRSQNAHP